ncbi:MAG: ABC transporter permease [Thioalkalispiraceae bacterium]|jgi:phospholipid/cholesterol/gamma-HCH transport system permease protein
MTERSNVSLLRQAIERFGIFVVRGIEEAGYIFRLFYEALEWVVLGRQRKQPVRIAGIFNEAMQIGIRAIPIIIILCLSVGIMLAIQGIETLKTFGAEAQVVLGIALSITREFSPLIVSILVAGRSGSAIAARVGTMLEAQEIDALRVIGINPVRYLVVPILFAMLIALPCLVILGDAMGLLGGALYTKLELNLPINVYFDRSFDALSAYDVMQGLIKSVVFALIIALVGLANGFQVKGGAEGVGRATTRSVVMSISLIVIADMVFTYFLNR